MDKRAIGMFDSGVGGLTVLQEVKRTLPQENIVYFADTARLPYGSKSPSTIVRYSIENAIFLMEQQIKVLVIPCNTATAHALEKLRKLLSIPIIGVIEPGAEKAAQITTHGHIAVLGTKGTIQSGAYKRAILSFKPDAQVLEIACPLFVPLVEEQFINHPATRLIAQEYLKPLKDQQSDTLLLGCTHYPLLRTMIQEVVGSQIALVDSATTCAEKVATFLQQNHLKAPGDQIPTYQYFVSDDPEKFKALGEEILAAKIDRVTSIIQHSA